MPERAEQFDLRASAALIIRRGGKPYAVISFYYDQLNTFVAKTVELLEEMASNNGFPLDRFFLSRTEKRRCALLKKVRAVTGKSSSQL